jgi:hypothetical protein
MQQAGARGIDSDEQQVLLVIELDHGFVNRDVIRICPLNGL